MHTEPMGKDAIRLEFVKAQNVSIWAANSTVSQGFVSLVNKHRKTRGRRGHWREITEQSFWGIQSEAKRSQTHRHTPTDMVNTSVASELENDVSCSCI